MGAAYSLQLFEALVPLGTAGYLKAFTPEQLNACLLAQLLQGFERAADVDCPGGLEDDAARTRRERSGADAPRAFRCRGFQGQTFVQRTANAGDACAGLSAANELSVG